jgi:hypothetical protein
MCAAEAFINKAQMNDEGKICFNKDQFRVRERER